MSSLALYGPLILTMAPLLRAANVDQPPKQVGDIIKVWPDEFTSTDFAGVVRDSGGKPIPTATVFANHRRFRPTTAVDSAGRFKLTLPPRSYGYDELIAAADGGARMSRFFPLHRSAGKDVVLTLEPAQSVRVVVKDGAGKPVSDAWIQACGAECGTLPALKTGADGTGTVWLPPGTKWRHVIAYKDGAGLDYKSFAVGGERSSDPALAKGVGDGPIALTLGGARQVTIRILDENRKPLQGVSANTWYFEKTGRGETSLNVAGMEGFSTQSGPDGIVRFRAIPADHRGMVTIWIVSETHVLPTRLHWDPAGKDDLEVVMEPKVELSGTVLLPDRSAAAGAVVQIRGNGPDYTIDSINAVVQAGPDGRYSFRGASNMYYQLFAAQGRMVSTAVRRVVAREPAHNLTLKLWPATRVYGSVTGLSTTSTGGKTSVWMTSQGVPYNELPEAERIIGKWKFNSPPDLYFSGEVGSDGAYELWAGPGVYQLAAGDTRRKAVSLQIGGEKEIRRDLERPATDEWLRLDGRVVLASDPSKGVAGASVGSYHRDLYGPGVGRPVSGQDGTFFMQRRAGDHLLEARTADGKLAGVAELKGRAKSVVVKVAPTASVKGRLVDGGGKPVPNREVTYTSLEHTYMWTGHFSGKTTSNDKGEFTLPGLVVGRNYIVNAAVRLNEKGEADMWNRVFEPTPQVSGVFEAGDLRAPAVVR